MTMILAEPVLAGDWLNISLEYDPEVIEIVKALPYHSRMYHPETKEWSIKRGQWNRLVRALEAAGHRVLI